MTEEEIAKAIGLGENDDYEFKDNRRGVGESILTTVSAFANTLGGVIICGVLSKDGDETHEPVGLPTAKKHKDDLWNTLNNKQSISYPSISSGDIWVSPVNGKDLVCVRVKPADRRHRPVYIGKNPLTGTYKRGGTGDHRCSEDEVQQMLRDKTTDPQDAIVFGRTTFDEVDPATFAAYRSVLAAKHPGHADLRSDKIDFLRIIGGWRDEPERGLTLAGVLMFGRSAVLRTLVPKLFLDYCEQTSQRPGDRYQDRFTSFDGGWEANLFNFYYRSYPKLTAGLKTPFALSEDAMRSERTPFHEGVREALVNTIVHADYRSGGTVRVGRERDSFVFENSGRFLTPLERILAAGPKGQRLSDVRNHSLLLMFYMLGLSEGRGFGCPAIFRTWAEGKRHPPEIVQDIERNIVTVTLPLLSLISPEAETVVMRTVGAEYALLPEIDKDILLLASQCDVVTNESLQRGRQEHARDIGARLKALSERGWLKSAGAGRGTTYSFVGESDHAEPIRPIPTPPSAERVPILPPDQIRKLGAAAAVVEASILEFCRGDFRTLREIAAALGRRPARLRDNYITPLVAERRLVRRHPEALGHPNQAYRTAGT
jgi:ATP-dependent DNA helicase RecG